MVKSLSVVGTLYTWTHRDGKSMHRPCTGLSHIGAPAMSGE